MVLGNGRIQPQSVAYHVRIRYLPDALSSPDIDVPADYHGRQPVRSLSHHTLIERQLQVEQCLRQLLSPFPAEHGYGSQYLATGSIRRQATALTARMQDDTLLTRQPVIEIFFTFPFSLFTQIGLLQQPGGSPTRPQLMAYRVVGTKKLVVRQSSHIMETLHQIRWQRKQFLHLVFSFSLPVWQGCAGTKVQKQFEIRHHSVKKTPFFLFFHACQFGQSR